MQCVYWGSLSPPTPARKMEPPTILCMDEEEKKMEEDEEKEKSPPLLPQISDTRSATSCRALELNLL